MIAGDRPGPSGAAYQPYVSVVINTDGRVASLEVLLNALQYLEYDHFEVCVVYGPTDDGTEQLLDSWRERVRVARCPVRNLSISRNIGIRASSGELIAFIDDDAIPEPEWLRELVPPFIDRRVGGAGGFVYDHTGTSLQFSFTTTNRLADADVSWPRACPELCFPFSANFPHLPGGNSCFRFDALASIGGFDEEYAYFLDETDLCCRLVDNGWELVQVPGAYVHHKFLASHMRNEHRVIRSWYQLVKNKIYFAMKNSRGHYTLREVLAGISSFVDTWNQNAWSAVEGGFLNEADYHRFRLEVVQGWRDGLLRAHASHRKVPDKSGWREGKTGFLPFTTLSGPAQRRTFCLLTQTYPPAVIGGIARYVHQLARSMASLGHHVHVLSRGLDHDTVDFEEGVWVHRIVPRSAGLPSTNDEVHVPERIWNYSATMLAELNKIGARQRIDCVYAPIWDCEGLAVLMDGQFPLVTSVQTTLHFWLESQQQQSSSLEFMAEFAKPMLSLERRLMKDSAGIHAISQAIMKEVEQAYSLEFDNSRVAVIPLGLEDWTTLGFVQARPLSAGAIRLLYVGRLEARKGIDVLLGAAKRLLSRYPTVHLDIVGNDTLPGPGGSTYRSAFEADREAAEIRSRVTFHGEIPDEEVRGLYRACDIFVAPSRFESFGLIVLEAMMFGKPIVTSRAGGIVEIVEDGVSALLAEPGDAESLETCLIRLVEDRELRRALGANGRAKYLQCFTPERMTRELVAFLSKIGQTCGSSIQAQSVLHDKHELAGVA